MKLLQDFNRNSTYALFLLLLLPSCLFLSNELIWDDTIVMHAGAHWSFKAILGAYAINSTSYWRPLAQLSIVLPYLIGLPVWACKLISIGLYYIQGCLAIAVLNQLLRGKASQYQAASSLLLAILLALHPIFVETTLWISARADLLMGIFVLLGLLSILQSLGQGLGTRSRSTLITCLRSFMLTWLVCASKDTGLVWSGIALVATFLIGRHFKEKRFTWYSSAAAIASGLVTFCALRTMVLGLATQFDRIPTRPTANWLDRIGLFGEVIIRSFLEIVLPVFDSIPVKAAGQLADTTPAMLGLIALVLVVGTGILVRRIYRSDKVAAALIFLALLNILFHAVLQSTVEISAGNILAARYIAISAMLIFIALASFLCKQSAHDQPQESTGVTRFINLPVALVCAVILVQSAVLWFDSRSDWTSNINLWEKSWAHGTRTEIAAQDYSGELYYHGHPIRSREIALYWIENHRSNSSAVSLCHFYDIALKDDIRLNDEAGANTIAHQALDIGWCRADLAKNIAFVLMNHACPPVRVMLEKTLQEGHKPEPSGLWQFEDDESRKQMLLLAVYAEARCGTDQAALELLTETGKIDPRWAPDGKLAQSLLDNAHAQPK